MKHSIALRRVMLSAAALMLLQQGAAAWAGMPDDAGSMAAASGAADERAPLAGSRPSLGSLTPQPAGALLPAGEPDEQASAGAAQGDVATLMQLIHDSQLIELRTTYNASYGASLFFYPSEMTYYVVLFQDKHFWRVIRSQDEARSEAIYADFVRQTAQLADVEIRRTQLEAQKAFIEHVIALSEERARRLQADLAIARTQQARVDDYQRQVQGDATALNAQKAQAQAQLLDLQRQVDALQRATEAGLPGARR
ncbi:DUF2968 domain-containing protein [Paraburkholderia unamae]|uniref:DUF2968 family protein n=1 Tax=Paraburkholderia unamae TaxID=219649 RepID=A0ABX5KNI8_9BURK|nr:DUF2968 domain-containing protein [Paraburkholderia unamae]PVX83865.1 hypothetical protein C7402_106277 [Paraburkholderia unamae]RAR64012.1 hypothetical protein C7401_105277 [Paraburkholderia unamae]CAG9274883.1 conserved exported hypothetical protein [Paraburkholderia unamae]